MSFTLFRGTGITATVLLACLWTGPLSRGAEPPATIRPPATPLIVHDPYFSIWSFQDRLTDGPAKHWTGAPQPLTALIRIDGVAYRFAGDRPRRIHVLAQT